MIYLIAGSSHTGKTLLAQRLLEHFHYPYLSIDLLKMGLIRSGLCPLSAESSDKELTAYLWPILKEIINTAIENNQSLIVEGVYIPFNFREDFSAKNLEKIKYTCLIFSEGYINKSYGDILKYENIIENRKIPGYAKKALLAENAVNLALCQKYGCNFILIDEKYEIDMSVL